MDSSEKKIIDFDNIIGLDEAKNCLKEYAILPVEYPQLFEGKRYLQVWTLLCGPSGTGKTYLSKAVESELNSKKKNSFVSVTLDKFINKSLEERINILNELFQQARNNKPSAVFIDNIDSILNYKNEEKEDTKNFMEEFYRNIFNAGTNKDNINITIFGATNKPWELDRPTRGRFRRRIYIDLPEANDRKLLIKFMIGNNNSNITEEQFEKLGNLTQGYSGKDIYNIIQDSILTQQEKENKKEIPCITFEDVVLSIQKIKPSNDKKYLEIWDNFKKEYKD